MTPCTFAQRTAAFVCLIACASPAFSQDKPKKLKPEQLLLEARKENGFGGLSKPWHLQAQYQIFDAAGKPTTSGTYEEWWYGPRSYKVTYTGPTLKQTDVATEQGLFRTGDARWPNLKESAVAQLLTDPMGVHPYDPKTNDVVETNRSAGDVKIRCVTLLHKPLPDERMDMNLNADIEMYPSHCFAADSTMLRLSTGGSGRNVVNISAVGSFAGNFISKDVTLMNGGLPAVRVHLLTANTLPAATGEPFTPGEGATPIRDKVELDEGVLRMTGGLREAAALIIPDLDPEDRTPMKVRLTVNREGKVQSAEMLSGPPRMQAVVVKAARKLTFQPYTVLGTPVEVSTTYSVDPAAFGQAPGGSAGGRGRR